jgi:2-polyprenyl-3-methyl-5-hydroxy-6-metoxy-1,4-benzoquinol methylase
MAATAASARLRLPQRAHIARVDHSDPLPYYYALHTGWLFRYRLQMALDLLGPGPFERLLEAGYGSGILLPTLKARARELHAMDLHRCTEPVVRMLEAERVSAEVSIGTVCSLGYAGGSFDALVCLSTLEHLRSADLRAAVAELRRVLKKGGIAVVGVPASGWLMDLLFHAIGFGEIDDHHVSTDTDIETELRRHFMLEAQRRLPPIGPARAALYTVYRCRA